MSKLEIQNQQQGEIARTEVPPEVIEKLVLYGDLSGMQPQEKTTYYNGICKSLGLNPLTQPFAITKLNGKEVMYAKKDATEQLRRIYGVSVTELVKEQVGDIYMVTAKGVNGVGRTDSSIGAVSLMGKTGENLANAIMKAETKAKRRLTLSICGLGMLDETEMEDINKIPPVNQETHNDTQNIDLINPNDQNNIASFQQMTDYILFSGKVPELFDGVTSNESFVEALKGEFYEGKLTTAKANAIGTALNKYA